MFVSRCCTKSPLSQQWVKDDFWLMYFGFICQLSIQRTALCQLHFLFFYVFLTEPCLGTITADACHPNSTFQFVSNAEALRYSDKVCKCVRVCRHSVCVCASGQCYWRTNSTGEEFPLSLLLLHLWNVSISVSWFYYQCFWSVKVALLKCFKRTRHSQPPACVLVDLADIFASCMHVDAACRRFKLLSLCSDAVCSRMPILTIDHYLHLVSTCAEYSQLYQFCQCESSKQHTPHMTCSAAAYLPPWAEYSICVRLLSVFLSQNCILGGNNSLLLNVNIVDESINGCNIYLTCILL